MEFNTIVSIILNDQRYSIDGIKLWVRMQLSSAFYQNLLEGGKEAGIMSLILLLLTFQTLIDFCFGNFNKS
jgi:hypothetical protein